MRRDRLPSWLMPYAVQAVQLGARFLHPVTMGVRAAVIDEHDRVYLVKHSYTPGWHLPGGGVEPGETVREAMARELREEAELVPVGEPVLHGIFFNRVVSRRDHVAVYVVRTFERLGTRKPDWEIVGSDFFELADLPDDTTPATRARLSEITQGLSPPQDW